MTTSAMAAPYAAYVMDARTGETLYSENADTRLHPASLTKMMTLYLAFQAIEHGQITLDTPVTITSKAAGQAPSKLGLRSGQRIALRYLIRAAAIKSANDAAMAIGEAIGGDEDGFAAMMNATARQIGMKNTTFKNPNGLTREGHLSTAHDMSILGRHLFYDYPQYYNIFSRRSADAGIAPVYSTNAKFLNAYKGADGIKTGYTSAAGFNLTASAQRGNVRIIATILGGQSTAWRNSKMADLLDMGFARAPKSAPVQKPSEPAFVAKVDDGLPISPTGAGKTIRLQVAVEKSLRPIARPGNLNAAPPEMLVAMSDGIDAALAAVQPAAAEAAVAPDAAIAEMGDEEAEALGEAPVAVAGVADLRPEARPADLMPDPAPPAAELAALVPDAATPAPMPAEVRAEIAALDQVQEATETVAAAPVADPAPAPATGTAVALFQSTAPQPETLELAETIGTEPAAPGVEPPPSRPGMIMLVSSQDGAGDIAGAPELEVVSRASTSGGRHYGITIGHYASRYNAERALLQTALTESATLGESLRKVVPNKGGYDANFVGLSDEMAAAACRRFEARGRECTVVGP
ncbi:D-alanyl-D-alanine carboxypeptidase family protein [Frigidibacter sp. MR17.24]|uniref:D-alanyl-D-alanine carboxypeptidase family protein n=1 Tax=Frigidibacter sp. MR17.24 TaxID=3127345 RepID=UPI003012EE0E